MRQYLGWMWRGGPRSLRAELLVTIVLTVVLAVATMVVLGEPGPTATAPRAEETTAFD